MARLQGSVGGTTSVVPVVSRPGSPIAARLAAAALGLPAGLVLYSTAAVLFAGTEQRAPATPFVLSTLLGGWGLAAIALSFRTTSVVRVVRRALVLGAAQWLLLAPLVARLSAQDVARVADLLRSSLRGLPVALPDGSVAVLLASACGLGALFLAALPAVLGVRPPDRAR
jgi:hypothetical protein